MRHQKTRHKLSRDSAHRKALLANLCKEVIEHERIKTTEAKAKAVKPELEKLITLAKRGDLHARRQALSALGQDKFAVHKLFEEVAPRYAERPGGYTRILKLGPARSRTRPRWSSSSWSRTTFRQCFSGARFGGPSALVAGLRCGGHPRPGAPRLDPDPVWDGRPRRTHRGVGRARAARPVCSAPAPLARWSGPVSVEGLCLAGSVLRARRLRLRLAGRAVRGARLPAWCGVACLDSRPNGGAAAHRVRRDGVRGVGGAARAADGAGRARGGAGGPAARGGRADGGGAHGPRGARLGPGGLLPRGRRCRCWASTRCCRPTSPSWRATR